MGQPTTFFEWIRRAGVRLGGRAPLSSVGLAAAARWIATDACWPVRCTTIDRMLAHLYEHPAGSGPDEVSLRVLHERYRAFAAAGGEFPKAPPGPEKVHRGYLIPKATEDQIRDLKEARSQRTGQPVTLGEVIAREIERAWRREVGLKKAPPSC